MPGIVQISFLCQETMPVRQVVGALAYSRLVYSPVHVQHGYSVSTKTGLPVSKVFSPSEPIFAAWQTLVYWVSVRPQDKIP